MSLATLLLALAPAFFRPKLEPEKTKRETELEAERDAAYDALELMRVERDSWRRRYEEARDMLARGPERRAQSDHAAMQLAQMAQAQYQAQQNQLAGQQQLAMQNAMAFGHGQMLGAQAIAAADFWCNCVPARHDMLLRR